MSDPAGTKSDGGFVWGTQVVTCLDFSSSSATYIADDIDIEDGSRKLEAMNAAGVVNRKVHIDTPLSGRATFQLADGTTKRPKKYATVALTPVGGDTAINFLITKVGQAMKIDGETKIPVELDQKLN